MIRKKNRKKRLLVPPIFIWMIITTFSLTVITGLILHNVFPTNERQNLSKTLIEEKDKMNSKEKTLLNEETSVKENKNNSVIPNGQQQQEDKTINKSERKSKSKENIPPGQFYTKGVPVSEKVKTMLEEMTLEDKIGQMLIVGFQSDHMDKHIKSMIEDYHVGGVILYDRNMKSPKQVAGLNNDLQSLSKENKNSIPLYISIDQEGGSIVRMKEHVTSIPSQKELGQKGNSELIYSTAFKTGKELMAMGIQLNFAPVLDLSDSDSRSFGKNPENTAGFGKQIVSGLSKAGMTATIKHFPGNGRSNIDPHVETSSIRSNKLDLENGDIYPFKEIIENKDKKDYFVMVTHIKYPAYDVKNPASISSVIIKNLLRTKLGYEGIVVTDDLEMGAVSKYFTYEDLGYKAVEAGNDLLLVCHTFENQKKVFNGILAAVKSGKLTEKRIDEAVARILTHKLTKLNTSTVNPEKAAKVVGN